MITIISWENFCCHCFQVYRTSDVLKCHIKDRFKINGKQRNKMITKGEYTRFKNYEKITKFSFTIYTDFESNGKKNTNELYSNKYQKHVGC